MSDDGERRKKVFRLFATTESFLEHDVNVRLAADQHARLVIVTGVLGNYTAWMETRA